MQPIGQPIDQLGQLSQVLNTDNGGKPHAWICGVRENGARSIQVLSDEAYTPQRAIFWNRTCEKLSLIQLASFAKQLIVSAAEKDGVVWDDLITNQQQICAALQGLREKAVKKIDTKPRIIQLLNRIWYWFFDPKDQIAAIEPTKITKESLINHAFTKKFDLILLELITGSNGLWNNYVSYTLNRMLSKNDEAFLNMELAIKTIQSFPDDKFGGIGTSEEGKQRIEKAIQKLQALNIEWFETIKSNHCGEKEFTCLD